MNRSFLPALLLCVAGLHQVARCDDVTLSLEVVSLPGNRVRLTGKTSLPPTTALMLSVKAKGDGGFHGQSKCAVAEGGTFESEVFGPKDGLGDGRYVAEAMMPIPAVQPPRVQAVIGKNGEHLTGALVSKGDMGTTVSQKADFSIGDAPDAAQAKRNKEVAAKTAALKKQLCVHLEQLEGFKDDAQFKQVGFGVGGPYNKWLKSLEALRDAQPVGVDSIPITLRAAPGDLMTIGMEYMRKGETAVTRQLVPELKDTIDYADYLAAKKTKARKRP